MPKMKAKTEEKVLSAFERRRLENIAANQTILKDLANTSNKIMPDKPKPAPRASRSATVKKEAPATPAGPTRRSARVAGLDADNETLKRKYEVELEDQAAKEKAKKTRVSGDLKLGDIAVDGKKWNHGMESLGALLPRGAQPGVPTFTGDDVENTSDKDLKELRQRMNGLELYEKWSPHDIKICPLRIYSSAFHPTEEKPLIFAGDKEGALGVFDASQPGPKVEDDEEAEDSWFEPVIGAYKLHTRTITSILVSPFDHQKVYTSSYDSTIRVLDLQGDMCVPVWEPQDKEDDVPLSGIDVPLDDKNLIYFSTLQGGVGRVDIRAPKETEIWPLCDNKIGGFSLYPREPHLVATASLDRTVKIWDTRNIKGKGDMRYPEMIYEHDSRLSVSHAAWSSAGHIATSSYDDTIKIYNFADKDEWDKTGMEPAHIVKHNNQTGRWVTILKPQWQKRPKDGIQKFTIGNMNRFVDVYAANGEQLAQLGGDGISAVPAVAQFHPTMDWVAGGTASGKLCLWQ
ncbi:WD repeat-containing protein [Colletotrichum karsti]|uniref:DNA damage-binding protein CMR1 n=1 Tax=Colletotrichum karsti TaxID=1095194 RepID=A0A9P6LJ77_9PEZI|nr:WD repeat-containing protein [Colletotrichum karsti]KAF9874322.1 WD repeat-containing protein [Colletotrichum karsti]